MNPGCPELEALFAADLEGRGPELEHARTCVNCGAVLAEHRELSRSLDRLRDPLPPEGFVTGVMARVDEQVKLARRARWQLVAIFAGTLGALAGALALVGPGSLVTGAMDAVREAQAWATVSRVFYGAVRPVVSQFSVPLAVAQLALVMLLTLGIRRLVSTSLEVAR